MQKDYRRINREVMTHTYELCSKINSLKKSIEYSISNQKVILETDNINPERQESCQSKIFVSKKRTYEAARAYKGRKIAVLNFANNHSIVGAPYSAGAQEESLCRCSTLLPCLEACESTFYQPHRDAFDKGVLDNYGNDDIIYTPRITVFKTDESDPELLDENYWFNVDVITCAAPEVKYGYNSNLYKILVNRITRILDIASKNGVEVLILGAFGCGAFGNPPEMVAKVFHDLLCHYNFDIVEFAVFTRNDATNYDVFNKVIYSFNSYEAKLFRFFNNKFNIDLEVNDSYELLKIKLGTINSNNDPDIIMLKHNIELAFNLDKVIIALDYYKSTL